MTRAPKLLKTTFSLCCNISI